MGRRHPVEIVTAWRAYFFHTSLGQALRLAHRSASPKASRSSTMACCVVGTSARRRKSSEACTDLARRKTRARTQNLRCPPLCQGPFSIFFLKTVPLALPFEPNPLPCAKLRGLATPIPGEHGRQVGGGSNGGGRRRHSAHGNPRPREPKPERVVSQDVERLPQLRAADPTEHAPREHGNWGTKNRGRQSTKQGLQNQRGSRRPQKVSAGKPLPKRQQLV